MRINVGWLHKYRHCDTYTLVKAGEGGGTRYSYVLPTANQEAVIDAAKGRFIESINSKSCFADITHYAIGRSDGTPIELLDLDGNVCDMQSYLSCRGQYITKTIFYLLTSDKKSDKGKASVVCIEDDSKQSKLKNVQSCILVDTETNSPCSLPSDSKVKAPEDNQSVVGKNDKPKNHYLDPEKSIARNSIGQPKTSAYPIVEDIKDYHLEDRMLGKGGFREVHKGKWIETVIAVKKLKIERLSMSMAFVNKEVDLLRRLRHPNIVQLLAIATKGKHLYVCTEYIDGGSLESLIFDDDAVPFNNANKFYISLQLL